MSIEHFQKLPFYNSNGIETPEIIDKKRVFPAINEIWHAIHFSGTTQGKRDFRGNSIKGLNSIDLAVCVTSKKDCSEKDERLAEHGGDLGIEGTKIGERMGLAGTKKSLKFVLPLPNSIRVVRKILDLYVLVRIQVGQQASLGDIEGRFSLEPNGGYGG